MTWFFRVFILINTMLIMVTAERIKRRGGHGGGHGGDGIGGGRGDGSSSGSGGGSGKLSGGVVAAIILGGLLWIFMPVILVKCYCCIMRRYIRRTGRSGQSNEDYIKGGTKQPIELSGSVFVSGMYQTYYFQYGQSHGLHDLILDFHPETGHIIEGGGTDDIGTYIINGIYSSETLRMGLTKKYQSGTGNPRENLGHQVTIQVEWNVQDQQFQGKYYLRTEQHTDENTFIIQRKPYSFYPLTLLF